MNLNILMYVVESIFTWLLNIYINSDCILSVVLFITVSCVLLCLLSLACVCVFSFTDNALFPDMTFVDPCIIVQFTQKNPTRCNSVSKFIIPYLYEAQLFSGDTLSIIRNLKLH